MTDTPQENDKVNDCKYCVHYFTTNEVGQCGICRGFSAFKSKTDKPKADEIDEMLICFQRSVCLSQDVCASCSDEKCCSEKRYRLRQKLAKAIMKVINKSSEMAVVDDIMEFVRGSK
jgi:hypothetical protein